MDDTELRQRLEALETQAEATYAAAEKTRKYILGFVIMSVAAFVLPLIGMLFVIPQFISVYTQMGNL